MQKFAYIENLDDPNCPCVRAEICDSFFKRLRGLMFKKSLPAGEGILLSQTRESVLDTSIHMLFMHFDLAVVWVSSKWKIVDIQHAKPWRMTYSPCKPAQFVLELPVDYLGCYHVGDQIAICE